MQAKKGKKKRTFCIAFAMNTNFLLLFPFFGDILYSRNGCLRFASVDLQKSLLPLITIGDSECPFRSSRRILPEVAGSCRRFFCAEKRQKKNDDADASPLKLVLECRDFNVALLFESLGNIPEKKEESVLIAVPHAQVSSVSVFQGKDDAFSH